jgi:hypothetical protein
MAFAATLILSAYLLFLVQPMVARVILPWFGGSPSLWTLCMIFFQIMLFGGYLYSHLLATRCSPKKQYLIHASLLTLSLLCIPPLPSLAWRPDRVDNPELQIMFLLIAVVGLPYLVLATTAPLMQVWYAKVHPGRSPYRLYGWSNASSLLALLMYPTVFEMNFTVRQQGMIWAVLYAVFVLAAFYCARLARNPVADTTGTIPASAASPGVLARTSWFLLPALASALLLAVTNELSQDVAVMPFLWVMPLAVYLITFIICFDFERLYLRALFLTLVLGSLGLLRYLNVMEAEGPLWTQIAAWLLVLFSFCMVCHGELVRRKPNTAGLTLFYLHVAAGGAIGGIFVGVLAPRLFDSFLELPLLLGTVPVVVGLLVAHDYGRAELWKVIVCAGFAAAGVALTYYVTRIIPEPTVRIAQARNFFGVLRVEESRDEDGRPLIREMYHGRVVHGAEFQDPADQRKPLIYYSPISGAGLALRFNPKQEGRRIGVVGLGAGSMAGHARAGDIVRFYEINPLSEKFAHEFFHFVPQCPCTVEIVRGDARVSLEQEAGQQYDLLALDAFSGDAIPVHLLTEEAVRTYMRHLAPDGILAFHISNWYLNLVPVVRGLAETFGLYAVMISSPDDDDHEIYGADWVLLTRNPVLFDRREFRGVANPEWDKTRPVYWTDDFHSLLSVVDWGF